MNSAPDKTAKATKDEGAGSHSAKIDRTAPAGSGSSLGAESVRDGRPTTDDRTIEAIDELGPTIVPPENEKTAS